MLPATTRCRPSALHFKLQAGVCPCCSSLPELRRYARVHVEAVIHSTTGSDAGSATSYTQHGQQHEHSAAVRRRTAWGRRSSQCVASWVSCTHLRGGLEVAVQHRSVHQQQQPVCRRGAGGVCSDHPMQPLLRGAGLCDSRLQRVGTPVRGLQAHIHRGSEKSRECCRFRHMEANACVNRRCATCMLTPWDDVLSVILGAGELALSCCGLWTGSGS